MSYEEMIAAFHAMWDNFPEPVMLIQKDRKIHALNAKAKAFGIEEEGKCTSIGTPEQHKSCLCNRAVDEKRTVCSMYDTEKGKGYGYWMPVAGAEDYIIHFGVGRFSEPET